MAAALVYRNPWRAAMLCAFLALMPAVTVIDVRHRIIPNRLTYPALIGFPIYVVVAWALGAPLDPVRAGLGLARLRRRPPARGRSSPGAWGWAT